LNRVKGGHGVDATGNRGLPYQAACRRRATPILFWLSGPPTRKPRRW